MHCTNFISPNNTIYQQLCIQWNNSAFNGIYRDDGINVIFGQASTDELCDWLDSFQTKVNEAVGDEYLQFTLDIWNINAPADEKPRNKKVTINRKSAFPYLDMELYWRGDELKFRVHLKPNQQLKYLNKGSTHTNATFKSIPHGVIKRLSTLTICNSRE